MMLTDLADVARTTGLPVVEHDGWRERGHGEMAGVRTIVCHHTAGPATGDMPSLAILLHGRPDLAGPLAHYGLSRSGVVHVLAAGCCWHAGTVRDPSWGNRWSIGIEAEATGTTSWPDVQVEAYARLAATLVHHHGLDVEDVRGHKEVCAPPGRKSDPNLSMTDLRARVRAHLITVTRPAAPPAPTPTTPQEDEVLDLAQHVGTTSDGHAVTLGMALEGAYRVRYEQLPALAKRVDHLAELLDPDALAGRISDALPAGAATVTVAQVQDAVRQVLAEGATRG